MKIDSLSFYKVNHNEDAHPYIFKGEESGFIAVADGLGGSGSYVHKLSDKCKKKLRDFSNYLLFERLRDRPDVCEDFFDYVSNYVKPPIIDDKPDTSALWGSRVVISRFAYYMHCNPHVDLSNEKTRLEICDFIYGGMKKIVKEYNLEIDGISHMQVLPTTLNAIRYKVQKDGSILAEVIWAGDSRAYALVPNRGLIQLSQDDENKSGAICNLFAIKDGKSVDTVLNYKRYILPPKSCIFVCSDGIFELFDTIENIAVETTLLECIEKSNSFEELEGNWYDIYRQTNHDDCTVAFLSFGNYSFDKFKKYFEKRFETLTTVCNDYYEKYGRFIPIVVGLEDNPETYVRERANDRKDVICDIIADELLNNSDSNDLTLTQAVRDVFITLRVEYEAKNVSAKESKKCGAGNEIIRKLIESPCLTPKMFAKVEEEDDTVAQSINELFKAYEELAKSEKESCELREKHRMLTMQDEELNAQAAELEKNILDRRNKLKDSAEKYDRAIEIIEELRELAVFNYGSEECDGVQNLNTAIRNFHLDKSKAIISYVALDKILAYLNKGISPTGIEKSLYSCDLTLLEEVKSLIQKRDAIDNERVVISDRLRALANKKDQDVYVCAVQKLNGQNISTILSNIYKYIAQESIGDVQRMLAIEENVISKEALCEKIIEFFDNNPLEFERIIDAFVDNSAPTIIDRVFNQSALSKFRELKTVDISQVKRLIFEIDLLDKGYSNASEYEDVGANANNKGNKRMVDFVFCIDATHSMETHMNNVRSCIWDIMDYALKRHSDCSEKLVKIRVKTILFRDYSVIKENVVPIEEFGFFNLPSDLLSFNKSLSMELPHCGDENENGLEALNYAMKSNFKSAEEGDEQFIILFSDADAVELGERRGATRYPKNMVDGDGLRDLWYGGGKFTKLSQQNKRLIIFSPVYGDDTAEYEKISKTYDKTLHIEMNGEFVFNEDTFDNWLSTLDKD